MTKALLRQLWRRLPSRLRPWIVTEPLRLILPRAYNLSAADPLYVAGYFSAPTGLGQSARLFFREMQREGHDVRCVDLSAFLGMPSLPDLCREKIVSLASQEDYAGPGTVVIHINPPAFMVALWVLRRLLPGKRVAAYWAWELETVPRHWARCMGHVDEILAPSVFVADALKRCTDKPVRVHPHAVTAGLRRPCRGRPFTILYCCEIASGFWRKNPQAAVLAFKEAFGASQEARLLLKIGGIERYPEGMSELVRLADTANIRFCLGYLGEQGMDDLYAEADVYLSLHRSEGYGLHMREAALRGLPVIATGWSGNMDFMQGGVPYALVPVHDPQGCYHVPGTRWAEPDVAAAAQMLRNAWEKAGGADTGRISTVEAVI